MTYEIPPDSGTMKNVSDQEVISAYVTGLNSRVGIKSALILANLPIQSNPLFVDVGCMTGKVAHDVWSSRQEWRVEGIDVNSDYIAQSRANYPDLQFHQEDASKRLSYEDNSVSAFSMSAVLHEIYTYNGFSQEPVLTTLREMHRALRSNGIVILREPAMPLQPNELLHISLSSGNGANPDTKEALFQTVPRELSVHSMMRRFLLQFEPLNLPHNQQIREQIVVNPDGSYELPAWLIGEFLRKRTFNDTQEHWNAEMGEQNAPFTSEDTAKLAQESGFQNEKIRVQNVFEEGFYGEIKEGDGITIADLQGKEIKQAERFPSHIYALLEK